MALANNVTESSDLRETITVVKIGYARVSTPEQSLDRQVDELSNAGCERVFSEAASGKRGSARPEWERCVDSLRAGDTLLVTELSRLGRNTGDLGQLLDTLDDRDVSLSILNLGIDTRTPAGRLIFTIVGAVAQMERDLLIERTQSGLAAARARGRRGGRRQSITAEQIAKARRLYAERRLTMAEIARVIGYSPATLYRHLSATPKASDTAATASPSTVVP
jgi:DNA invertase Pin-like site-specific DNA recombinase